MRLSVDADGTARVDGVAVTAAPGQRPEEAAVAHVAARAAALGRPVAALAQDGETTIRLHVHPDGTSEPAEAPAPTTDDGPAAEPVAVDGTRREEQASRVVPRHDAAASTSQTAASTSQAPPSAPRARPRADALILAGSAAAPARAREGWRGALAQRLGLPLAPGAQEQQRDQDLAGAQAQLAGPRTVMVVNPKGGVGKTTSTLLLAAALGVARGGGVLAWDNNETRGTMALRSQDAGHGGDVRTLLAAAPALASTAGRLGDLDAHVHHQRGVRFDVLPSEQDPSGTGIVDADDFAALHDLLNRFYRLVLVDTGNNIRATNWQAAARASDQLVITTTVREDSGTSAAWMLDALADSPHAPLLTSAVTLLHDPAPRTSERLRGRLAEHFAAATSDDQGARVLPLPYEPSLAGGGRIDHDQLSPAGRRAWLHAAATVVEQLTRTTAPGTTAGTTAPGTTAATPAPVR